MAMESSDEKKSNNLTENRRKDVRKDFSYIVLEFVLHPDTTYEIFVGYTLNLSNTGLCIYTSAVLKTGQTVILKSDTPPLYKKAVVRWVDRYDSFFYKVGLEFL
jgi:hypothetical protein